MLASVVTGIVVGTLRTGLQLDSRMEGEALLHSEEEGEASVAERWLCGFWRW